MAFPAQPPDHLRKLEELEQRIAVLKHFDKQMASSGKSLENKHDNVTQRIGSLLQWAQSESTILHSRKPLLCGEEHEPCSTRDIRLALEHLTTSLGMDPVKLPTHPVKLGTMSARTISGLHTQAPSALEATGESSTTLKPETLTQKTLLQDEGQTLAPSALEATGESSTTLKPETVTQKTLLQDEGQSLDDRMKKAEAAGRCLQEAHRQLLSAQLDEDGEACSTDPLTGATNYWMQLATILASDIEKKTWDESVNFSEVSLSDSSYDEDCLLAYKDALDQHIRDQQLSVQEHGKLRVKLKQDIHFLDKVIAHLAAENLRLIGDIEQKHAQAKKSTTRVIKLLESELQWLARRMTVDSTDARACLCVENTPAAAHDTPAVLGGTMVVQEASRDAVLQEYFNSIDRRAKDEKLGFKRVRLERRVARAEALLTRAESTFREKNPIAKSLEMMETLKNVRTWEKALPLVKRKVEGRTFAEWLPDILQIIGEQ